MRALVIIGVILAVGYYFCVVPMKAETQGLKGQISQKMEQIQRSSQRTTWDRLVHPGTSDLDRVIQKVAGK